MAGSAGTETQSLPAHIAAATAVRGVVRRVDARPSAISHYAGPAGAPACPLLAPLSGTARDAAPAAIPWITTKVAARATAKGRIGRAIQHRTIRPASIRGRQGYIGHAAAIRSRLGSGNRRATATHQPNAIEVRQVGAGLGLAGVQFHGQPGLRSLRRHRHRILELLPPRLARVHRLDRAKRVSVASGANEPDGSRAGRRLQPHEWRAAAKPPQGN